MNLSEVLKKRRSELGYTLLYIANKMGVSEATVQRWESGNIKSLRQGRIAQLAEILKVSPAALMGWDDEAIVEVSVPNRSKNYFHFRVETNDMIRAFIPQGAYVQVRRQNFAEDGQIVCCLLNEKHVLRRYRVNDGFVCLSTENDINDTKVFTEEAVKNGSLVILGAVKSVTIDFFSDNEGKE